MEFITKEAENLLFEIIEHESDGNYWAERFEAADHREDTILRGCFKELKDNNLVHTTWADNIPVIIQVLKDGYLYQQHKQERELSEFLNRQNRNGQKLILPIVHNITMQQLQKKYPNVANIQAIDSKKYNCDQIALLFAKQLIKRLKAN